MKHDDRGLSLVELIIAITISAVIMGVVIVFISSALRSYNTATNTIDLQMESHVMMEQLSAWIMEGNHVEIPTLTDGSESVQVLVIYRIPRVVPSNRLPNNVTQDTSSSRRVIWMEDGRLYMMLHEQDTALDPETDSLSISNLEAINEHCICEYMTEFTPAWDENYTTVKISVQLMEGKQEYELENTFKVRNEIL